MDLNVHDYNNLLEQFSTSVVKIYIYRWGTNQANSEEKWLPVINLSGIVTVSGTTFCHIIVCGRRFFYQGLSPYLYKVVFPDETSVVFDVNTVKESDWLASFYVPTPGKKVDAVQFSDQNADCQDKVWVFGYDHFCTRVLDKGTVTHVGDGNFDHDCPPNYYTFFGYPVFSLDKKLVGISYYDYGVTRSLDVKCMTSLLSTMVQGMNGKALVEILERIKVLGEEKYGKPQDSGTH